MTRRLSLPILAVIAATAAVPSSAFAQTPAPTTQASASHLAVAREVVLASGIARSVNAIAPEIAGQMRNTLAGTRPEVMKDLDEVLASLRPEIEKESEEMIATTARIFATRLTEAELTQIAQFFTSPAGRRYVDTQPLLLDAMFTEMQAWSQRLSETVVTKVRAEMRRRGHEI